MNVVAYLNGEPQITDNSPCVCVTVRKIAIFTNDFLHDDERHEMLPFLERAMGSYTAETAELSRRAWLAVDMANGMAAAAAGYVAADAGYVAADADAITASEYAAAAARYATKATRHAEANNYGAAADAAAAAAAGASYAAPSNYTTAAKSPSYAKKQAEIKRLIFVFLDAALPKSSVPAPVVIERARKLIELSA